MTHDNKDNHELKVIFKRDRAGAKELHLSVKGRLVIFFLGLCFIAGCLWANGQKPDSLRIPEGHSFPRLELSYLIYNRGATF
jgi:hypothetical protein